MRCNEAWWDRGIRIVVGSGLLWAASRGHVWGLIGVLQLATAVRRWRRLGAQWAMVLSGGQSALAGAFFLVQSRAPIHPAIGKVAGYAAVGAVYFLVSSVWLSVGQLRRKAVRTT